MSVVRYALALACLAAPAAAQWRYDPGPMPAGRAIGPGTAGYSLVVECGNGGYPAVLLEGYTPPQGMEPAFVASVDDRPEHLLFTTQCNASVCMMDFDSLDAVFGLLAELRAGQVLDLGLYRGGPLTEVPLGGSSAAIGQLSGRGCEIS
ncbi:hypothetical protein [Histidinibacterium aquaticum]|uniref:Uncharacterized protein n=1 Tax=Histidinibacterium aquaticum TaxID=2613962 RepID=A0A5J5GNB1_9RHOB|nr:hypothetical protein [Histidinibacterium aquaticum]KAA9009779.1 hypothetical protein F3S47_00480 [Histidinibacterium aquaticum]